MMPPPLMIFKGVRGSGPSQGVKYVLILHLTYITTTNCKWLFKKLCTLSSKKEIKLKQPWQFMLALNTSKKNEIKVMMQRSFTTNEWRD